MKELPFSLEDLNIKAVLLDENSRVHETQLFDSTMLKEGTVIDTSRIRGQLIGMKKKNMSSYVGHKPEIYKVIRNLSSRS